MTGKSQSPKPKQDAVAQADRLVSEATAKQQLNPPDVERANAIGKMTQLARVEFYTSQLLTELRIRCTWFEGHHRHLSGECERLRDAEKELHRIQSTIARDRWEAVVALLATGLGAGLISTCPLGSTKLFLGLSPEFGLGLGWSLVAVALVWQVAKLAGLSVADLFRERATKPQPQQEFDMRFGEIDITASAESPSPAPIPVRSDE